MHSDADLSLLAVDLVAAGSHFARAAYQVSEVGLSYVSLRALAAIEREPGLRVGELAVREGITQPSMSQTIKRLVDDGLLERTPSAEDARASDLTITEAGRVAVRRYRADSAERIVPFFKDLSPGDIDALQRAAEILPGLTKQLRENLRSQK